jgi:hypothetical protein
MVASWSFYRSEPHRLKQWKFLPQYGHFRIKLFLRYLYDCEVRRVLFRYASQISRQFFTYILTDDFLIYRQL